MGFGETQELNPSGQGSRCGVYMYSRLMSEFDMAPSLVVL